MARERPPPSTRCKILERARRHREACPIAAATARGARRRWRRHPVDCTQEKPFAGEAFAAGPVGARDR
eukprot:1050801-Pyramimonas_sp.AAC.1